MNCCQLTKKKTPKTHKCDGNEVQKVREDKRGNIPLALFSCDLKIVISLLKKKKNQFGITKQYFPLVKNDCFVISSK